MGTEIQIPVILKNLGNISIPQAINTKVLKNDIIADTFPFENAVNIAVIKILIPAIKKLTPNRIKPLYPIRYTLLPFDEKISIMFDAITIDNM